MAEQTPVAQSQKLLPAKTEDFPVLAMEAADFKEKFEIVRENLGGRQISPLDLDRVKVPAGGGKVWELPTLDGEVKAATEWDGVIIAWRDIRVFWADKYEGGGVPPDCVSDDGVTGKGAPGGACRDCPLAVFGTAVKEDGSQGRGQACQAKAQLFVLVAGSWLPTVLTAPPTSITPIRRYLTRLASRALPFYGVMTRFGLEPDKSADGFAFSKVLPTAVAPLADDQRKRARAYSKQFAPLVATIALTQDDYAAGDPAASPPPPPAAPAEKAPAEEIPADGDDD